jgi:hypothetical protein
MLQGTMPVAVCTGFDANGDCTNQTTQITNIDPTAQAYITDIYSKIPALTNTVDNTLTWVGRNVFNYREENVRIDHNFGPKLSVFGRFLDDSIPTQEPGGYSPDWEFRESPIRQPIRLAATSRCMAR